MACTAVETTAVQVAVLGSLALELVWLVALAAGSPWGPRLAEERERRKLAVAVGMAVPSVARAWVPQVEHKAAQALLAWGLGNP